MMLGGGSGPGSGNISGSPQISNTPTTQSTAAPSRSNTPDSTQQQTSIEKVTAISGKYYKLALKSKERYDTNNLKEFRNFKVSCQLEGVSYNDDSCIGNLQGIDKNNTIDIKVNKCYSKGMSLFNRNVIDASIFRIYDCDMNNNTKTYVYTLTAGKTYDTNLLKDFAYVKINCNYTDPNFCLKEKQVVNFVNGKFLILDSNSCYNKGLNLYNTNSFDSVNLRFIDCAPKK
ncbi:MAG: hypothetical protein ORN26_00170 [Candidatus Pacebacteria bacterium]|nr:hypothetical protein [Candidatus Paceibacterota bacterium]